ncbi:MAG: ECF transporter S component [Bacteroidaceae bacterium]|nr:ECF transporter S component [Bacteroidaceae bacterium]
METNVKLYSLGLTQTRTYLLALVFVVGNVVLPQLCHLIPQGGLILLPIYFFTLVGAYKYGLRLGLLTAVFSPVVNHLLFGMPAAGVLPILLIKSSLLAVAAAVVASRSGKVTIPLLLLVVLSYQFVGGLVEWAVTGSLAAALQDFRLGLPGLAVQVLGGYVVLRWLMKK